MSQELHYTSVARGLKPGSRGFGTVAATANLPESLADRLEGLSAYQAVYPPGDPSAALNPVAFVHVRLSVGGQAVHILSRIGPAGLDYSGRPNKYAHHVVLGPGERPEGGPAWLLSQPGFLQSAWDGEPRILAEGRLVPGGDRPAGIAQSWLALTGDAGWAGVLAESFLSDPRRPVFLVFRPGIELLPLFVETIALLPASRRWDVEFSTYLTNLPPGVSCAWRGVLDGSAQAKNARRLPNALIVDLCRPIGRAQGGALVHLARTGERLEQDVSAIAGPSRESGRSAAVTAGPPPSLRPPARGQAPGASADRDWLPDLAARLGEDVSLLGGDRPERRQRPRKRVAALLIAACLVPMIAGALYWSPDLRQRIGLAPAPGPAAAGGVARPPVITPEPPDRIAARLEKPRSPDAPAPSAGPEPPTPTPTAVKNPEPGREEKVVAKPKAPPTEATKPAAPAARQVMEPLLLAFATPQVARSGFSSAPQGRAIRLPEDADDRITLRNGPDFHLKPAGGPQTWEIATRTGSGLGGGFPLARLNRVDARTWRFEWTSHAKAQSTQVEALKDAILEFHSRDGRPIRILLRDVELERGRPLEVWKDQKILFEKLDTRFRSVEWGGNSEVLEGSRWKPRIRRWKVVISRSETDPGADKVPRRIVEPEPAATDTAAEREVALERDLVPGEIKLKLAIDPSSPGSIDVRIEPDAEKVREGQLRRTAALEVLSDDAPKDQRGDRRDPLEFRRAQLSRLRAAGSKDQERMKTLERDIAELERIKEIRGTEDLLTRPARVELSVVIGLDVDGMGILDIVRIGEFAGRP